MPPDKLSLFMPKTVPDAVARPRLALGLLIFFGMILFLMSAGLLGGVFFYKRIATQQVDELRGSLKRLEADFEPTLLTEFIQTADAINAAKNLLGQHRATSEVFEFLEANTLKEVKLANFSFTAAGAELSVTGQAESYTNLALQAKVFEAHPMVRKVVFSNLNLNEKGGVRFSAAFNLDPAMISFK